MSSNITIEIPAQEAQSIMQMIDAFNANVRRMAEDAPRRDAEIDRLDRETKEAMDDIWRTIENVEKSLRSN
jgi:hypothetical protein